MSPRFSTVQTIFGACQNQTTVPRPVSRRLKSVEAASVVVRQCVFCPFEWGGFCSIGHFSSPKSNGRPMELPHSAADFPACPSSFLSVPSISAPATHCQFCSDLCRSLCVNFCFSRASEIFRFFAIVSAVCPVFCHETSTCGLAGVDLFYASVYVHTLTLAIREKKCQFFLLLKNRENSFSA